MMEVTGGMNCSSSSCRASVRIAVWSGSAVFDGCLQRLVPVLVVNTGRRVRFYCAYQIRGGLQNF
jgi:hypothetical protein